MQERLQARLDVPGRYSGITLFSSKIICGECGSTYGPRPWHSTSYNNLVWQCRRRLIKGTKCRAFNIYDQLLHYAVHDIAMDEVCRRNIAQHVAEAVLPLLPKERRRLILKWLRNLRSRDIWSLQSDEDDIALIIDHMIVMENGAAEIHLIDGSRRKYTFPEFYPAKHKAERQMRQSTQRDSIKKPAVQQQNPPTIVSKCQNCGAKIIQKASAKPRKFCCDKCRYQWWNAHLDQMNQKICHEITCQHCGKTITVYEAKRRKYCSHECYIAHRFRTKDTIE